MSDGISEPVLAAYDGVCELCGDMIRGEKDRITKIEEDDCWAHVKCAQEEGYDVDDE